MYVYIYYPGASWHKWSSMWNINHWSRWFSWNRGFSTWSVDPSTKNPAVDSKQPCDPSRVAFGKTSIMPLCKISGNNTCLFFQRWSCPWTLEIYQIFVAGSEAARLPLPAGAISVFEVILGGTWSSSVFVPLSFEDFGNYPKKTATILLVLYSEEKLKSEVDFRGAWCAILISRLFSHWLRIFKLQLFWLMLGVPVRARARKHSDTVPCWWEVHQKHSIDIWLVGAEPHISGVTKICLTPRP